MRPASALVLFLFLGLAGIYGAEPGIEAFVTGFRKTEGLTLPALDDRISTTASTRARNLAEAGLLSHVDPQGRGPGGQMLSQGFPPGEYGEILGAGASWEAVWAAWLASPSHRGVLASDGWTLWGWGRCDRGTTTVWVVRFYRP